jgi:hypothetical protein
MINSKPNASLYVCVKSETALLASIIALYDIDGMASRVAQARAPVRLDVVRDNAWGTLRATRRIRN